MSAPVPLTWAEMWTIGYDLDGGGYAFEEQTIGGRRVLVWDNPSHDYFPFGTDDLERGDCEELHVSSEDTWPESYNRDQDDEGRYVLVSQGQVNGSDHDCHCHGKVDDGGQWEATGNTSDEPYPDCRRCEGTGHVDSPGGYFAWYQWQRYDEDEDTDETEDEDDDGREHLREREADIYAELRNWRS